MQPTTKELIKLIQNLRSNKQYLPSHTKRCNILAESLVKEVSGGKTSGFEVFAKWNRV